MRRSFGSDWKNWGTVSQQVWHDKDPSLLKGPERRAYAKLLQPFAGNGDVSIYLDLCIALSAFSSEGSFTCHTYCDTGHPYLRSYPRDLWFWFLNTVLFDLAKEHSLPIFKFLGLKRPARVGLELTTFRMLIESLPQQQLNTAVFEWDRRCGTIKIPPCSKALSADHKPKFCSPSPAMVTSPYKWKILERDVKS
jgi:hypothetical protein